jgi:hypothetical protein
MNRARRRREARKGSHHCSILTRKRLARGVSHRSELITTAPGKPRKRARHTLATGLAHHSCALRALRKAGEDEGLQLRWKREIGAPGRVVLGVHVPHDGLKPVEFLGSSYPATRLAGTTDPDEELAGIVVAWGRADLVVDDSRFVSGSVITGYGDLLSEEDINQGVLRSCVNMEPRGKDESSDALASCVAWGRTRFRYCSVRRFGDVFQITKCRELRSSCLGAGPRSRCLLRLPPGAYNSVGAEPPTRWT